MRKYRLALDNLERLVVARMFELTKLGMSGIGMLSPYVGGEALIAFLGYKLREKIGKALKTRADAIKTALSEYNRRASLLKPPRPQLSWEEVMDMVSLADFDLLRETREDIRVHRWAQGPYRQAVNLHFGLKRAREEILRLNVEIRRLLTWLIDEHFDLQHTINELGLSNPALAHELRLRWEYHDRIGARIAKRFYETAQLPGFSGSLTTGKRIGRETAGVGEQAIPLPLWARHTCSPATAPGHENTDPAADGDTRADTDDVHMDSIDESVGNAVVGEGERANADHEEDDAWAEGQIPGVEDDHADDFVDFIDRLAICSV